MTALLLTLALAAPMASPVVPQTEEGGPAMIEQGVVAAEAQQPIPLPPSPGKPEAGADRAKRSPGKRKALRTAVTGYRVANPSLVRVGVSRRAVKLRTFWGRELVSIPLARRQAEPASSAQYPE